MVWRGRVFGWGLKGFKTEGFDPLQRSKRVKKGPFTPHPNTPHTKKTEIVPKNYHKPRISVLMKKNYHMVRRMVLEAGTQRPQDCRGDSPGGKREWEGCREKKGAPVLRTGLPAAASPGH